LASYREPEREHLPLSSPAPHGHFLLHLYQVQVGEPHSGPGETVEGRRRNHQTRIQT
jgi:hypothetical protein